VLAALEPDEHGIEGSGLAEAVPETELMVW
jgi:hypothetical protein